MKRLFAVVLTLVMLCLSSCQIIDGLFDKEDPIIDNTEASLNHEKIYLTMKGTFLMTRTVTVVNSAS